MPTLENAKERGRAKRQDPSQRIPGMPPNYGEKLIPHVVTFQGILASIARVYRASDEAMKESYANARYMLNDLTVLECLEQRMRSTALLGWHLEVDDEKNKHEKALKDSLTSVLRRIPRFMQYREALLRAIWYGRYAVQHRYEWDRIDGDNRIVVKEWLPVHGDKLAFGYDEAGPLADRIGIRVGPGLTTGTQDAKFWRERSRDKIRPTDYGLAYFLDPWELELLAIHKHLIEDGEFETPENAGRIHGLGIRSRIFWSWIQKQELLAWLMEYLERSSFGIEIWYYPWGSDQAREELRTAAEERIGQGRNIILVPKPMGEEGMAYGVDRIEPGMAGAESCKDILQNYFGHLIKRYILGQTLTSEAQSTGLGSNLASVHLDTYLQIVKYDATNLQETVTEQLVDRLKAYNHPEMIDVPCRFIIETETADIEQKLQAWKNAFDMGVKLREKDVMELIGAAMPEPDDAILQNPQFQQLEQQPPGGQQPGMQPTGADDPEGTARSIIEQLNAGGPVKAPQGGVDVGGQHYAGGAWMGKQAAQTAAAMGYARDGDLEKYRWVGGPPQFKEEQHPRAKEGGTTIGGEFFPGGKFIPKQALDRATPQELAQAGISPEQAAAAQETPPEGQEGAPAAPGTQGQPEAPGSPQAAQAGAPARPVGPQVTRRDDGSWTITTPAGGEVKLQPVSREQLQALARTNPEAASRSSMAAGGGIPVAAYHEGTIYWGPDATPEVLPHEMIHAMRDMGAISQAEIDLFGDEEGLANAYGDWVSRGREDENGIFQRIWDLFAAMLGSQGAAQRQLMRRLDAGKFARKYERQYSENPDVRFAFSPEVVNYGVAQGLMSEETLSRVELLTDIADVDREISKHIKTTGPKGGRSVTVESINRAFQERPEFLKAVQDLEDRAFAMGDRPAMLDPVGRDKLAPYMLENRPKVWTNVFPNYVDSDGNVLPEGTPGGEWCVTDSTLSKAGKKFVARRLVTGLADKKSATAEAQRVSKEGATLQGRDERLFGKMGRSIAQTYLETLPHHVFEKMRSEAVSASEKAYQRQQELGSELPSMETALLGRTPKQLASEAGGATGYRVATPIKEAHKTVAAMNLNSVCPMFQIGNHGCYLDGCYLTSMASGAQQIGMYRKAMYTGELLRLRDEDVTALNELGGLRMNGMGDLDIGQAEQLKDVMKHAAMRGLKMKVITKQDDTFEILDRALNDLEREGHNPDVMLQPSMDPYWIPITEDDMPGSGMEGYSQAIEKARGKGDYERADALAEVAADRYREYGRAVKTINGKLYRKYGFSPDQLEQLQKQHPRLASRIQPRVVIGNGAEAVWAAKHAPGAVVTWMHARVREGMYSDALGTHATSSNGKNVRDTDIGNFQGRPAFLSPEETGTGRWEMRMQPDRGPHKGKVVNTATTDAINRYIYDNHADEADSIYQNLKGFSCCQSGASRNACQDCVVHCANGRSDNPNMIPLTSLEGSAAQLSTPENVQKVQQALGGGKPKPSPKSRLKSQPRKASKKDVDAVARHLANLAKPGPRAALQRTGPSLHYEWHP